MAEAQPKSRISSERRYFIGGSDARTILGDDEAALLRLWREKRGEVEPEDLSGNLVVQLGIATEDLNRRWYESNTGQVLTDIQRQIRHPALRWMAATLDGRVEASGAVFEAKIMLPWAFSEEAAVEKYTPQLQHNMWVVAARSAVLSVITGGGKWVEITTHADPLYQHLIVTGLTAATVIGSLEDAEDYKAFEAAITADYDAQSAVERELILRLASILWRLRRATTMETGLFEIQADHLHNYRENRQLLSDSRRVIHTLLRGANSDRDVKAETVEFARCFLRLANLPNFALDRLSRYEATLWRQAGRILFALDALDRRKPQERRRRSCVSRPQDHVGFECE